MKDKTQNNDNFDAPNAIDEFISQFETTFVTLEQQCSQLFIKLLRLLSISIGMKDIDFFANKAKSLVDKSVDSYNIMRTLYYPSLSSLRLGQEEGNSTAFGNGIRFSEHTDWGIFTIVFRDAVDGLEVIIYDDKINCIFKLYCQKVRTNDGDWIPAEPEPGNMVLFVGDLLELWTGKYFKAAVCIVYY